MTQQTPFYKIHMDSQAVMVERHNWLIPAHYGDPESEYQQCCEHVGVFDTSWQSRIRIAGDRAEAFLSDWLGADMFAVPLNHHRCIPGGDCGLDLVVQHQDKGFVLIADPKDHQEIMDSLNESSSNSLGDIAVIDETSKTAMVTLIGPSAWTFLNDKLPFETDHLEPGRLLAQTYLFFRFVISREDCYPWPGASIILPAKMATLAWDMLIKYGQTYNASLAGVETYERICRQNKS